MSVKDGWEEPYHLHLGIVINHHKVPPPLYSAHRDTSKTIVSWSFSQVRYIIIIGFFTNQSVTYSSLAPHNIIGYMLKFIFYL